MSVLYVGLDLSLRSAVACFLQADETEPIPRFMVANTPAGVQLLVDAILRVCQQFGTTQVKIGLEATGLLAFHLGEALRHHPQLQPLQVEVHTINARWVAKYKQVMSEQSKTDSSDAFVIACRLKAGHLSPLHDAQERYLALQKLTRHRLHLVETLAAEKNRFLAHLFLKFSGFCQDPPVSDPFGAASSALLTEFLSVEQIAETSLEQLGTFLQEKSRNRFADPEALARAIQAAARLSFRLKPGLADSVNLVLAMTLQNVRFFEQQLRSLDQVIEAQLAAFGAATVLRSVPGIGLVYTAGILSEVQEVHRFETDAQLAKYAGLIWKQHQSGEFRGEDTPLAETGNRYLRYYLVEAADSVRKHNPEYGAYYQAKLEESSRHGHKRACVLTARKLVRLIHTLLRKEQLYQTPAVRKEVKAAAPVGLSPGEVARQMARRRQARGRVRAPLG